MIGRYGMLALLSLNKVEALMVQRLHSAHAQQGMHIYAYHTLTIQSQTSLVVYTRRTSSHESDSERYRVESSRVESICTRITPT